MGKKAAAPFRLAYGAVSSLGETMGEIRTIVSSGKGPKDAARRVQLYFIQKAQVRLSEIVSTKYEDIFFDMPNLSSLRENSPLPSDLHEPVTDSHDPVSRNLPDAKILFSELIDRTLEEDRESPEEHPAFREIVKQLLPDEALLICLFAKTPEHPVMHVKASPGFGKPGKVMEENLSPIGSTAGLRHPQRLPEYIDNLIRLGILRIYENQGSEPDLMKIMETSPEIESVKKRIVTDMHMKVRFEHKVLGLTPFGRWFIRICPK